MSPGRDAPVAGGGYHRPMADACIRFAGRYRFERRVELDRALGRARDQLELEDELPTPVAWLRGLVVDGATLTVALAIPASAELRFAAAALFEALAQTAVEGLVEGTLDGRRVDFYPPGAADD